LEIQRPEGGTSGQAHWQFAATGAFRDEARESLVEHREGLARARRPVMRK